MKSMFFKKARNAAVFGAARVALKGRELPPPAPVVKTDVAAMRAKRREERKKEKERIAKIRARQEEEIKAFFRRRIAKNEAAGHSVFALKSLVAEKDWGKVPMCYLVKRNHERYDEGMHRKAALQAGYRLYAVALSMGYEATGYTVGRLNGKCEKRTKARLYQKKERESNGG